MAVEIALAPDGRLELSHQGHKTLYPVSALGATLIANTLLGIAMQKTKLNEKGAPSQAQLNGWIKSWQVANPAYVEPSFMKDLDL